MSKILAFISGALMGAAVGAAVALVMAPESGETLRGQLDFRTAGWRDTVHRAVADRQRELEYSLGNLRSGRLHD